MSDTPSRQDATDVTVQTHREWRLSPQRNGVNRVDEFTAVLRGVNAAVVSATTRGELAETVCERLADAALYRTVCMADRPTWTGTADRWTVAGATADEEATPPVLDDGIFDGDVPPVIEHASPVAAADGGQVDGWTVVPITYDGTIYGALGLLSPRPAVSDRERGVLSEVGEVIGHAIDAVETRRLLADAAVIELELGSSDGADPLVEAAREAGCRFELEGLVPATETGSVAYLRVERAPIETASERLTTVSAGDVRPIREHEDGRGGLLAWTVGGDSLLGHLATHGTAVTEATVDGDGASYTVELASSADVRALLDRVQAAFAETWLDAKRELDRSSEPVDGPLADGLETLTDRQHEVLEAAYRAGYYRWPRDSTAADVAETLDISRPTLHAHLRKAENQLLGKLFDADSDRARARRPQS